MISTGHEPTYTWSEMQKQIALAVKHDRQQRDSSATPRTWVGLTDEEIADLMDVVDHYNFPEDLIVYTQAKLKEKNGA